MADLHFVDFALIPSPASYLIHNLSEFDFTDSPTDEPFRVPFSRAFSSFHIVVRPALEKFYTKRAKQEISTFPLSEVEIVAY